jgi:hypothetical protein
MGLFDHSFSMCWKWNGYGLTVSWAWADHVLAMIWPVNEMDMCWAEQDWAYHELD